MCVGRVHWDDRKQKKLDEIGDCVKRLRKSLSKHEVEGDTITAYGDLYAAHYLLSDMIRHEEETEDAIMKTMQAEASCNL